MRNCNINKLILFNPAIKNVKFEKFEYLQKILCVTYVDF